jgi:hypothetical protein
MPKIVVLGSCRHGPYIVLAVPNPIPGLYNTEEGYQEACKTFYPAIDKADVVLVYNPERTIGEHTQRDIDYACSKGKLLIFTCPTTTPEEKLISEAIVHARAIQDYLWGWANKEWGIEEWRRMLRKRVEKLDELDPNNPHYNVELRKRVLQTAAVSIALLTEMEKRNIKSGVHPSIPSNLTKYAKEER